MSEDIASLLTYLAMLVATHLPVCPLTRQSANLPTCLYANFQVIIVRLFKIPDLQRILSVRKKIYANCRRIHPG